MAKLLLFLLIVGIICAFLARRERKPQHQRFVVEEGVYENVGATNPPPPKQYPEIQKLESLVSLFERTQKWALLVEVGDIYARGCFPFYGTDADTACRIYQLASRCPDGVVAAHAMSRFADTRLHPISPKDTVGQPFSTTPAKKLCTHAEYHIERCPNTSKNTRRQPKTRTPTPVPEPVVVSAPVVVVAPLTVDKQNVHDHSISRTTKKNVKDIVIQGDEYNPVELIDNVMSELRMTKLSEKKLANAFRVLVSLVPDKIESIGCSQIDVLNATKSKIDSVGDQGLKKNLIETLGKNLASGIERGHVVCSTGKIARIVSTLEGTDLVKNKAVPIEIVRREIGELASKVRSDVLNEVSAQEVIKYNTSSLSGLSVKMRKHFEQEVNSIYVKGLGLSQKVLAPIIRLYAAEF